MKIRNGFVSNSSSSSFIAVGLSAYNKNHKSKFEEMVKAMTGKSINDLDYEDLDEIWYYNGICKKDRVLMYTSDCEPFFIGIDAEEGIRADKRLSEIKEECQMILRNDLGIIVTLDELVLELGEASSG